jgi:hypothetical protein
VGCAQQLEHPIQVETAAWSIAAQACKQGEVSTTSKCFQLQIPGISCHAIASKRKKAPTPKAGHPTTEAQGSGLRIADLGRSPTYQAAE